MTATACATLILTISSAPVGGDGEAPVDFNRDVRPILAAKCFTCHGPDEATREGDLRLDLKDEIYKEVLPEVYVVKPGDLKASELWYRVSTDDEYEEMPPFWFEGPELTDAERDTLKRWIEEGGSWSGHWAYEAPTAPTVPDGVNAIDHLAAIARGGPARAAAPPAKLLRRLSLDLIGLPPSVAEVERFEEAAAVDAEAAYAAAVERLLASPHYGEARARRWLDLARYADTHGYEKDDRRTMWRYRDWVIDAFNADMPYADFTAKQLAGDLLPEPTLDDLIATGFHRNTMVNAEGGTDPEEFRVAAVVDRVNTTGAAWLGSTLACAQCHTHKYDPFSHAEYYGLFAFFNQTQDVGNTADPVMRTPTAEQAEREAELVQALATVDERLVEKNEAWDAEQEAWEREAVAALGPPTELRAIRANDPFLQTSSGNRLTRTWSGFMPVGPRPATDAFVIDARALEGTPLVGRVTALRLQIDGDERTPVGRADDGNFVLSDIGLEVVRADGTIEPHRFAGAWAEHEQGDLAFPVLHAIDGEPDDTGWAVQPKVREDHVAWFVLREPLELGDGDLMRIAMRHGYGAAGWIPSHFSLAITDDDRVRARYLQPERSVWHVAGPFADGGGEHQWSAMHPAELEHTGGRDHEAGYPDGIDSSQLLHWEPRPEWIDARVHSLSGEQSAFLLRRALFSETERRVRLKFGSDDSIKAYLNGKPILTNKASRGAARAQDVVEVTLRAGENRLLVKVVNYGGPAGFAFEIEPIADEPAPMELHGILRTPAIDRSYAERNRVRDFFRREVSETGRRLALERGDAEAELASLRAEMPTTMVMRAVDRPRTTHILEKGSFLSPAAAVEPHVPAALNPWPEGAPLDRRGLAAWLTADENPLTWRVAANRAWEELFGMGLVETSEDFGTRGEQPSNQALLDWLALELIANGGSLKGLIRTIVHSDTYRQDSALGSEAEAVREIDPRNVALTRGARYRLPAEVVRDNALAIAGLLDDTIGGPSVMPPQPEGIWAATYSGDAWVDARDAQRYRRGLYTFLRRTAPYPTYLMFDATSREVSCSRRARTNTPLQALAALNDPAFLEAAGGLALRMRSEGGDDDAARIAYGFRLCVARRPHADEVEALRALLASERDHFARDVPAAVELHGAATWYVEEKISPEETVERAAWIVLANALLNLDETLTRD